MRARSAFLVVTGTATQTRDVAWLKRNMPQEARAVAIDVTSGFAVLGLMGPRSRDLLQSLTDADLSNDAFPFGTSRHIELGYARVRASRIIYVGELGWELYVESEFVQGVFDTIMAESESPRPRLAGYHALDSLRMEKGYRHWGTDIGPEDTPLEAGLGFAVAWSKKGGFNGREALPRQKETGRHHRLVQFALEDESMLLYHNEPVWRDGRLVGRITSGMFGHTLGKSLGKGYVENKHGIADDEYVQNGRYEVEVAGPVLQRRSRYVLFSMPRTQG